MRKYNDEELFQFYEQFPNPPMIAQFVLSVLLTILSGFVVMSLWSWFIVPLGIMPISLAHAAGIDCLATFIVTTHAPNKAPTPFWNRFIFAVSLAFVVFISGWILHLFM